jgi:toxin ParE1/3/4
MAQIIWTEPALLDLDDIAAYIALDKYSAAQALVGEVFSRVEKLKKFPNSGRKPPELPSNSRYRELVIGPCRVFYRVEKNKTYVLYVMRSEKLLRKYILNDRDISNS